MPAPSQLPTPHGGDAAGSALLHPDRPSVRIIDATSPLPLAARPRPEGAGGGDARRGGSMVGWVLEGAPLIREAAYACGAGEIH